jgi:hypothetical protein
MSASSDALAVLRQVNYNLRSALIRLRPEQTLCSAIKPQDFTGLLAEITRAGGCLRRLPVHPEAAADLEQETREYLNNLGKLKELLPQLHGNLLAEKTRLETAQAHAAAAGDWAQASKKTL